MLVTDRATLIELKRILNAEGGQLGQYRRIGHRVFLFLGNIPVVLPEDIPHIEAVVQDLSELQNTAKSIMERMRYVKSS